MPEIGRRESGGGRRREDWGLPGLKMHVKSEARKSDGNNGEIQRYGRTREQSDDVRGICDQLHDGFGRIRHDCHARLQIKRQNPRNLYHAEADLPIIEYPHGL